MFRSMSFLTSLEGMIVLNAELKSMNSILTQVLAVSRWVSVWCSAVVMASSVLLFCRKAN